MFEKFVVSLVMTIFITGLGILTVFFIYQVIEDIRLKIKIDKFNKEQARLKQYVLSKYTTSDARTEPFYLQCHLRDSIDISRKELKEMFQKGMINKSAYCNLSMRLENGAESTF